MRRRREKCEPRPHLSAIEKVLIAIGIAAVIYLFVTEVLMRVLAALTPS